MNRTKIEWTDRTWNPITGCLHGCWYCYAEKLCKRFPKIFPNGFKPTFYPDRLKQPYNANKPYKIFVCSIADLWATWTPTEWRKRVLDSMMKCPIEHQFQMLTKSPHRIPKGPEWPYNWWFGGTVTSQKDTWIVDQLRMLDAGIVFVSFEPLLGPIEVDLEGIDWVIIGKLTGSRKVKLDMSWVMDISAECNRHKIPVFMKNNLGLKNPTQDFPVIN